MIKFRQKIFSEYDAMRSLYVELMKRTNNDRFNKFPVIDSSALIPILRGNNIVVERFVISTSFFGKDKYRMYLKIGAKAKLPDEVRLPSRYYDENLGNLSLEFNGGISLNNNNQQDNNSNQQDNNSNQQNNNPNQKTYSDKKGPRPIMTTNFRPSIYLKRSVEKLLGEAVKYDKKSRSLVLEFESIGDAIEALNILPFGIDYKIYLLNV